MICMSWTQVDSDDLYERLITRKHGHSYYSLLVWNMLHNFTGDHAAWASISKQYFGICILLLD
jgi:hypothetical protein